ncbi:MAG TPA: hypothetical protein VM324_12015 [Egibacteraceae bacterium]|jgi:hypothetical protein|nr:hypothetical protein [Egibacteraceae bacterium]
MAERTAGADEAHAGAPPGSGWMACATVVGIAVLVTAGVVAWARLGSGPTTRGAAELSPLEEQVPTELAGGVELGDVPDAVADAFDAPVVGARLLDEAPPGATCDFLHHDFDEEPELESVLVTPELMRVSMIGTSSIWEPERAPTRMRATCTVRWEGGAWIGDGGGLSPADEQMSGLSGSSCCDARGLGTAEALVVAPDGAAWAVQERGGYHLAYPVADSGLVPVSWRFRPTRGAFGGFGGDMASATRVAFVDGKGEVIGEITLRS